ncbi:MAG TPA: hypothetical protein VIO58_07450 [Candidatus Methanoperedens sp.]
MKAKLKPVLGYQICPFCGGNVEYAGISSGHIFPGINTGQMYVCRECGYQGSFIIEVDDPDDVWNIREELRINSEGIKTPAFKLPEKWMWFWKIMLVIMVIFFILGIIGQFLWYQRWSFLYS